jgi:hypothetical protein
MIKLIQTYHKSELSLVAKVSFLVHNSVCASNFLPIKESEFS